MCILKLPVFLLVLSVVLNHLKATPLESHQTCNTATCTIQRLANFLVRYSNNFGAVHSPTNVRSNGYGKRNAVQVLNKEPLNYLPL
uniref:Islet amyloid polypeptide n=1 Tax=Microcebus murinus TaxID=30608 RepID=A0A8C5VMQ4_MICMU